MIPSPICLFVLFFLKPLPDLKVSFITQLRYYLSRMPICHATISSDRKKSINARSVIYCSFTFLYVLNSTCKSALSSRTFKWYGVVFNGTQLNTVTKYLYCSFYWYLMFRFDNPLNYSQCTMTFTFDFHFFLIKCCLD